MLYLWRLLLAHLIGNVLLRMHQFHHLSLAKWILQEFLMLYLHNFNLFFGFIINVDQGRGFSTSHRYSYIGYFN